jgi:hypothetical protein
VKLPKPGSLNGFEFPQLVKQGWPEVGVLVISGKTQPGPRDLPNGVEFVLKPFGLRPSSSAFALWCPPAVKQPTRIKVSNVMSPMSTPELNRICELADRLADRALGAIERGELTPEQFRQP